MLTIALTPTTYLRYFKDSDSDVGQLLYSLSCSTVVLYSFDSVLFC